MNLGLKQLTIPELEHDLKSWEIAREFDEISESTLNQIRGKILAEIERRNNKPETLTDKAA